MSNKKGPVMTASLNNGRFEFRTPGFCPLCEKPTEFVAVRDGVLDEVWFPNWFRGDLKCLSCNSIPRERAIFVVIEMLYTNWRKLKIHESSPSHRGTSKRLSQECDGYLASQYDPNLGFGNTHPTLKYRSENLEHQTLEAESFDIVVTQDVFEHIFHPDLAIKEIARTLKPGGAAIMTVPIVRRTEPSRRRAKAGNDGITHILSAEYHGNPMSKDGSLVTVDWGFDIIDFLAAHSGLSTSMFLIDDLSRGLRASCLEVIICKKLGPAPEL